MQACYLLDSLCHYTVNTTADICPAFAFSAHKPHTEACVSFSCLINGDLDTFGWKTCMVYITTVLLNNLGFSWGIWPGI